METVDCSGGRQERRKEETRKKIIEAAMELFNKQGFYDTTMEQIAEKADVAKKTLYNHFPVKEAIVSEYIQRDFKVQNPENIQQLKRRPDTRSRMIFTFSKSIEWVREQKELFEKYLIYRLRNMISLHQEEDVRSGFHLLAAGIVELGQKSGDIRDDVPLDLLVDRFEFVWIEIVQQFYKKPEKFKAREVIERSVDLFINGAKPTGKCQ